jgi:hypothetical protein
MSSNEKKEVDVKRPLYVGETVLSKILKTKRVVESLTDTTVTLVSKKPKFPKGSSYLDSFTELMLGDFKKMMSLEDFEIDYIRQKDQVKNISFKMAFTPEEMASVGYKFGDTFEHRDTSENVMVGAITPGLEGHEKLFDIKLHSLDKMFQEEYLEYLISETLFKIHFKKINKEPIRNSELSFSF